MKALISGQAGLAIVRDGDHFCKVSEESPSTLVRIPPSDVRWLFGSTSDLREFDADTVEALLNEIKIRQSSDQALHLTLILLDRDEPLVIRKEAAECLSELFEIEEVLTYVSNRLYSAPMPDVADLDQAMELCKEDSVTQGLLERLLADQQEIRDRWEVWENLPIRMFGSLEDKRRFRSEATREGAFRQFVQDRDRKDWALYQMLSHPEFRGNPKARAVFQAWHEPFRTTHTPDLVAFDEETTGQSDHGFRSPVSAHAAFKSAKKQRDTIKSLLIKDRVQQALQYTDELINSQRRDSEQEHLAKSLCDLAQFAKDCGSPELQLTFALKATQEAPQDAWAYSTLGDAYRGVTKYQEALDAFQRSITFGSHRTGHLGHAEVLKDLGQFDEALEVLDFCISEFPTDEIAANSRAAAFAEFGRFKEALAAYDSLLKENPYDHVTRSGRAQVLRVMGRLAESLDEYNEIVQEFPQEAIPAFARAEVLREMGDIEQAELEMRSLIDRFPDESTPRLGRARFLRDLGRFDAAIEAFDEAYRIHPLNIAGLVGKADTFRKLGELELAKNTYQKVIDKLNSNHQVRVGLASVFVALSDYEAALDLLPNKLPATKGEWVAYHVRSMTFLRRGDFSKARNMLEWGVEECPWAEQREYFATALATCRIREGRSQEAIGLVRNISSVSIYPASLAIRMHAYAELGDLRKFQRAYDEIPTASSPVVLNLRDSISARYKSTGGVPVSDDQIFAAECDVLLVAA